MDNCVALTAYGNTKLPEGTEARPILTFALFAYNQEKYIREAVAGAFSQTYSPLEIILSDDCSSDRTFEIMQEMAAEYSGPHLVVVRRNERNLKPYSHVLAATKTARGQIIVLAAGDDISRSNRTSVIFEASRTTDAWAFHSRFDIVDRDGRILSKSKRSECLFSRGNEFEKYFFEADGPVYVVHGATSAYRRELIDLAPEDSRGILSDDGVLTIVLNMHEKRALFVEESLVNYRTHPEAVSNSPSISGAPSLSACRDLLAKEAVYAKNIADRAALALELQGRSEVGLRPLNEPYLEREVIIQEAKHDWCRLSALERLRSIWMAFLNRRLGYILPSMLGARLGPLYFWIRRRLSL